MFGFLDTRPDLRRLVALSSRVRAVGASPFGVAGLPYDDAMSACGRAIRASTMRQKGVGSMGEATGVGWAADKTEVAVGSAGQLWMFEPAGRVRCDSASLYPLAYNRLGESRESLRRTRLGVTRP